MDGSQKCHSVSSKSSIRASSRKPTNSGNNGNGYESDSQRVMSTSQKQPVNTKNLMQPTISARSKAAKTRPKKILTERNDSYSYSLSEFDFSGTHLRRTPILDRKSNIDQIGDPNSSKTSSLSVHSDNKNDAGEKYFLQDDSTNHQPYDPVNNYLSPRPKFLRYRPNHRREILLRREIESKTDGLSLNPSVSSDSQKSSDEEEEPLISGEGSLVTCTDEPELKHGTGESEIIEKLEDEEFEEGENWSLKWVLKILLVFLVLVLSTAYISSMNSTTSPQAVQFVRNLKNGYQNFEDRILRKIEVRNFGAYNDIYEPMEEASEMDFVELEIGMLDSKLPEDGVTVEVPDRLIEMVDEEIGGRKESNYDHHSEETAELSGHAAGGTEPQETKFLESLVDLSYVSLFRVLDRHRVATLLPNDAANVFSWAPSWCPSYHHEEAPTSTAVLDTIHTSPIFAAGKVVGYANKTIEVVVLGGDQGMTEDALSNADIAKIKEAEIAPAKPELVKVENDNEMKATYDYKYGYAPASLMYGFVPSLAVLVYLVTLFFKGGRARRSLPIVNFGGGNWVTRRIDRKPAPTIEQVEEGLVTTHVDPSPPIRYGSSIPYVESLSVRGVEKRSSTTSRDMESKMQESEDIIFSEERSRSQVVSGPSHAHPPTTSPTDLYSYGSMLGSRVVSGPSGARKPSTSTTYMHSYGSFIGQEVISKKNDGKDEATLTPVRRSSRIRNCGAKSS